MAMTTQFWEQWMRQRTDGPEFTYIDTERYHAQICNDSDIAVVNEAVYIRGDKPDSIIEEITELYRSRGKSFVIGVYDHNPIDDLEARLLEHGLVKTKQFDRRVAPVDILIQEDTQYETTISQVSFEQLLDEQYLNILHTCFPDFFPELDDAHQYLVRKLEQTAGTDDQIIVNFAAHIDGQPVATASLDFKSELDGLAQLGGASVLPDYRNQGIYSELLRTRAQYAKAEGVSHLHVFANRESSSPILERKGFDRVESITYFQYDFSD